MSLNALVTSFVARRGTPLGPRLADARARSATARRAAARARLDVRTLSASGANATPAPATPGTSPAPARRPGATGTSLADTGAAAISSFASQLLIFVPTEVLTAYIAVLSLIPTNGWQSAAPACGPGPIRIDAPDFWLWIVFGSCTVIAPLIVYFLARIRFDAEKRPFVVPGFQMIASAVALVAWTTYLPNSILDHCLGIPPYGGALIVVVTTVGLYCLNLAVRASGGDALDIPDLAVPQIPTIATPSSAPVNGSLVEAADDHPENVVLQGPTRLVITNPELWTIFLGGHWTTPEGRTMSAACGNFLTAFLDSSMFAALAVYGIGAGKVLGTVSDTDGLPARIDDAYLQTKLGQLLAAGTIPKTANTVAAFFIPPGVSVDGSNANGVGVTCEQNCGYHYYASRTPYAVIPYQDCATCRGTKSVADAMMTEICHEIAETVTNPWVFAGGYTTPDGGREIGDLCQARPATLAGYDVQPIWINGRGCVG